MAADSLKTLHTSVVDNRKGYDEAVRDAETVLMRSFFAGMAALKKRDHTDLHEALIRMGEQPDESGSFMATVHKTVISIRAAVTGLGSNALPSFVMGEEQFINQYDEAIKECSFDSKTVAVLTTQRSILLGKIAQMKQMEG